MAKIKLASILETSPVSGGEGPGTKPAKKVMVSVKKPGDVIGDEMKILYNRPIGYDNNKTAKDLINSLPSTLGVNKSLLYSSAAQEGMHRAILHPEEHSEAYDLANTKGELKDWPVDGFYNYGVDKFGENYEKVKKYLPADFDKRFKSYEALNEANEKVHTAAFKNNQDALTAKAAMMRLATDEVNDYAKLKGVTLDDKAANYFTLARYNASPKNFQIMMDEYAKAKDKNKFIDEGQTSRKNVHKNIAPRLSRMKLADELLMSK